MPPGSAEKTRPRCNGSATYSRESSRGIDRRRQRRRSGPQHRRALSMNVPTGERLQPAPAPGAAATPSDLATFAAHVKSIEDNLAAVIRGKPQSIRLMLVAMLAGGHVL